jgi:hypothetical protein
MKVAFVLRSAEVQPRFQDLCGNGLVLLLESCCCQFDPPPFNQLLSCIYTPWRSKKSKPASLGAVLQYKSSLKRTNWLWRLEFFRL